MENLVFEQAHLSWGGARLENLELEDAGLLLQARETRTSFSAWKALLGHRDAIDGVWLSEVRLRDVDRSLGYWPGRALNALDELRRREDLLGLDSFSLEGVWERMDGNEVPLSLKGNKVNFGSDGELEVLVGRRGGELAASSPRWSFAGKLKWDRSGDELILGAEGDFTIQPEVMILPIVGRFSPELRLADEGQFLSGLWVDGGRTIFEAELSRPSAEVPFSGFWELALDQSDLASIWKPLHAFDIDAHAKVNTRWNPNQGTGSCDFRLDGNSSSIWYRQVGLLSWEGEGLFRFGREGVALDGLHFDAVTKRGESLQISQSGEVRFPEMKGEDAKVSLELRGLHLDWFSTWAPWEMDETWKLSDASCDLRSEGEAWRFGFSSVDLLRGAERMASATKWEGFAEDANGSGWSLELAIDGSVEHGLLAELLPEDGPFGVFDGDDARGELEGETHFSSRGMVLKRGTATLASGGGARRLFLQSEREVKLDKSQPGLLARDTRGEWLSVKGNNLPIDGLIRWEGGGEVQGDAHAFSGKVSRDEHGWTFRSGEAVEIGNARIVHRDANYGEGLRARADLEVNVDREGRLRMNFDEFVLEGERSALVGNLELVAESSGNDDLFVSGLESAGLTIDLTTLTWIGFSEFPDLEAGSLRIGKLKAAFGDDFSFELDGAFEDFRVADEAPMAGGLQTTVRRQPDGFSTWARLSLVRENRGTDVTLDVFLPGDGNASRRKLSLSGEEVHLDELIPFASTIPTPADREALLQGKRFPDWARGAWELAFDVLRVKGLSPLKSSKAKLLLLPRALLLANAEGEWLGGVFSADGVLSLGSPDEPGVRLENVNAKVTQVLIENLTKRITGSVDAQLKGWSEGSGWEDILQRFAGKVTMTARNGLLRIGPMGEKTANDDSPKNLNPWSLTRLGKLLEGKASVADSRKALLQKMDSALEDIGYDLVQVIGQRAPDGNLSITELSVLGPSFKVDGKGKVLSLPGGEGGGVINLNLSVGARGELVEILEGLGVLAPVKTEGEYRMLKKNPLVVQGTMEKPDFSNFWALLAEGLGLGGFDPTEPK